jgi:photosystem II stability/assembly factor-like uncharacterized protein
MADSIIYKLPEEVRPEHIERYVVPLNSDGSLHLDNIHFRAHEGEEVIQPQHILAVGASGIFYSEDGVTWTQAPFSLDFNGYSSCTYSPNAGWIVAPGLTSTANTKIITSQDGINWFTQSTPWDGQNGIVWSLTYSPILDLIVATGDDRNFPVKKVMTSSDGINWTEHSTAWDSGGIPGQIEDTKWVPFLNKFVLVSDDNTSAYLVATSPDGITWTTQTVPVSTGFNFMFGVGHSNDTVFGLGSFEGSPSDVELYSTDGTTWTVNSEGSTPYNVYTLAYNSGIYVRGTNGSTHSIQKSSDGFSWSIINHTVDFVNRIIWSPTANKFIAVGGDGGAPCLVTSPDGTTWTNPFTNGQLFDVWDIELSL